MTSRLSIRKIYVDSRFKTADSVSNSNFRYELKEAVQLPDKCAMMVDDIIVPFSWFNIGEDNKYLYVRRFEDLSNTTTDYAIALDVQNHTFDSMKNTIQSALDTNFGAGIFVVTNNSRSGIITITVESQSEVKVFTDAELQASNDWSGGSYDVNNLVSANEVLSNYTIQQNTSITTGLVDLRRYHNIYIFRHQI